MGETIDVFEQNSELGMTLKNELEQWLNDTNAKIPQKDPLHNEAEEKEWLDQHKQKMKLRVEERRAFQLDTDYLPNQDWWGSQSRN
jgi:hypothetical protein